MVSKDDKVVHRELFWCFHPQRRAGDAGYTLFRRKWTQSEAGILHLLVSADNEYNLYLDGILIARGPVKSTLEHYFYDIVEKDVSAGNHLIAVEVVVRRGGWRSSAAPWSRFHAGGGLLIAGQCANEILDLPEKWRCAIDNGRMPLEWSQSWNCRDMVPASPMDAIDFNQHDFRWRESQFDDSAWISPCILGEAYFHHRLKSDNGTPWILSENPIGPLAQTCTPFTNLQLPLKIPAGRHRILADFGRNQTSMIHLEGVGGNGVCRIAYAEKLFSEGRALSRLVTDGGIGQNGYADRLVLPEKRPWRYDSFRERAGRYVELETCFAESCIISVISGDFSCYDFGNWQNGDYLGDGVLRRIYDISVHTARCCAHETYEDCPYYEQIQYAGDTRIQALISYRLTGNASLAREAIRAFGSTAPADGLTVSRFPCIFPQIIPCFSLIWILMLEDYFRFTHDITLIAEQKSAVCSVLEHLWKHRDEKYGLILPEDDCWNFTDWVPAWPHGCAGRGTGKPETILNLFYVLASSAAASLYDDTKFLHRAKRLQVSIKNACFSTKKGLFMDAPDTEWFSVHANALALLTGAFREDQIDEVFEKLLNDSSLEQPTLYFRFYHLQALEKYDRYDELRNIILTYWGPLVEKGFTTFPETPFDDTRSDCHGWSASPAFFLASDKFRYGQKSTSLKLEDES